MNTTGPTNFGRFFNKSKWNNIKTVDTCDILPTYYQNDGILITKNCLSKNNGSRIIDNPNYYKYFGNFAEKIWSDNTKWINDNPNIQIRKKSNLHRVILITSIIILIILICFLFII